MSSFKQILPILGMLKEQKNVRHLSFLKRVVKRVQNCIIEALGANCPQWRGWQSRGLSRTRIGLFKRELP